MVICVAIRRAVYFNLFEKHFKTVIRSDTLIPICLYLAHTVMGFGLSKSANMSDTQPSTRDVTTSNRHLIITQEFSVQ